MYREDINKSNELQNVSDAVNDISESCDTNSLSQILNEILMAVLQALGDSMDPNLFPLRLERTFFEQF
jgi:uncharacterized protein YoxC